MFNVLDYSCVSFPTGMAVDKAVDVLDDAYEHLGPLCKQVNDDCKLYSFPVSLHGQMISNQVEDDAETMHGLPISLQLVARRLEEEKVMAMCGTVLETLSK